MKRIIIVCGMLISLVAVGAEQKKDAELLKRTLKAAYHEVRKKSSQAQRGVRPIDFQRKLDQASSRVRREAALQQSASPASPFSGSITPVSMGGSPHMQYGVPTPWSPMSSASPASMSSASPAFSAYSSASPASYGYSTPPPRFPVSPYPGSPSPMVPMMMHVHAPSPVPFAPVPPTFSAVPRPLLVTPFYRNGGPGHPERVEGRQGSQGQAVPAPVAYYPSASSAVPVGFHAPVPHPIMHHAPTVQHQYPQPPLGSLQARKQMNIEWMPVLFPGTVGNLQYKREDFEKFPDLPAFREAVKKVLREHKAKLEQTVSEQEETAAVKLANTMWHSVPELHAQDVARKAEENRKRGLAERQERLRKEELERLAQEERRKNARNTLLTAAITKNLVLAQQAIADGADVNGLGDNGYTPLMTAMLFGSESVAKYLIEQRANIHFKANDGQSAKRLAVLHLKKTKDDCFVKMMKPTSLSPEDPTLVDDLLEVIEDLQQAAKPESKRA